MFVRHDSREQGSPLSPDSRGNAFQDVIAGEPDLLVAKSVHSAFLGSPDLAAWRRERGCDGIAVCGITTSHCCETTARAGSDIGFDVLFVLDATHAFDSGGLSADELARATAANLHGEFATVVATADLVGARPPSGMRTAPVAGTVSGSRRQLPLRTPNASLS